MDIQSVVHRGFKSFLLIWFGQLISLTGSGLTGFALGVWVYQHTGSVSQFALISLFTTLPGIIFSPIAGALVDRSGSPLGDDLERLWSRIIRLERRPDAPGRPA